MLDEIVWFSHREKIWEVNKGRFSWTDEKRIWDWDNCTVSFIRTIENKLMAVIRSNANINSTYMGEYLFTWGRVPIEVKENKRLINSLNKYYEINLAENAEITKTDGDTIIIFSGGEKRADIILDANNENALLKIASGAEYSLQVRVENDNINIYKGKPVELRYMLGFNIDPTKISEPRAECYIARMYKSSKKEGPKPRWVFQLDEDHWIWEWAKEGGNIRDSYIYELYQSICKEISSPSMKKSNIFDVKLEDQDNRIIPVIYQPAVDALDNFVREVHCAQTQEKDGSATVKVTLIFNNEQWRNWYYFLNKFYEWLRKNLLYFRTKDIESFKIIDQKNPVHFDFKDIYSKKNGKEYELEYDIHGNSEDNAPKHDIKYYFINSKHPVVFVNTSNHAMAEDDANHKLWKWEYIPWLKNAAIKLRDKTREQIEEEPNEPSTSC
jgi:hypothetical protein